MRPSVPAVLLLSLGLAGCVPDDELDTDGAGDGKYDELDAHAGVSFAPLLIGEKPEIVIKDLARRKPVTLTACRGHAFEEALHYVSHATFKSDGHGRVDLTRDATRGESSYQGVDPYGLMWSMTEEVCPFDVPGITNLEVRIRVEQEDADPRVLTLPLLDVAPGVTTRDFAKEADGFTGRLYLPAGAGPFPGLVAWGGSEGALDEGDGKFFASRGYAVLALHYFDYLADGESFPNLIQNIPLEYFGGAIEWMVEQPFVKGGKVAILGTSRGGEAALLVGSRYGQHLTAVLAQKPSDVVWGDRANGTWSRAIGVDDEQASWTYQGAPIPFLPMPQLLQELSVKSTFNDLDAFEYRAAYEATERGADPAALAAALIDVSAIPVPLFTTAGTDDRMWASDHYVRRIKRERFGEARDRHVIVEGAGHVASPPGRPTPPDLQFWFPSGVNDHFDENGEYVMVPEYGINGGTPEINHKADRYMTSAALEFLRKHSK